MAAVEGSVLNYVDQMMSSIEEMDPSIGVLPRICLHFRPLLPACLPACLACLPVSLPACLLACLLACLPTVVREIEWPTYFGKERISFIHDLLPRHNSNSCAVLSFQRMGTASSMTENVRLSSACRILQHLRGLSKWGH